MKAAATWVALALFTWQSHAAPNDLDRLREATDANLQKIHPLMSQCLKTYEGQTTGGRRECYDQEYARQDARLNQAYKKAMARLAPDRQKLLRDSQRAWLNYAGPQCVLEAGPPTGGTDWGDGLAVCNVESRTLRASFLESLGE